MKWVLRFNLPLRLLAQLGIFGRHLQKQAEEVRNEQDWVYALLILLALIAGGARALFTLLATE